MRRAWLLVIVGITGLVAMRVAYDLTYEPAPVVRVRWHPATTERQRAWLEFRYRLADREAPQGLAGLSYAYVLLDTSRHNIRALVTDPAVADTNDIDRTNFEIPWESEQESQRWIWLADRLPVLRYPAARLVLIGLFVAMIVVGARHVLRGLQSPIGLT